MIKRSISQIRFMREFIKNPMKMGSITPSSKFLANKMIDEICLKKNNFIIELGAGTGAITKNIIEKVEDQNNFLTVEINPQLATFLKDKFPNLNIAEISAEFLKEYLTENNLPQANGIISGLPWAIFNDQIQNTILTSIVDSLAQNGTFVTFAYIHALKMKPAKLFKQKLNKHFKSVQVSTPIWINIPPAIIYICKDPAPTKPHLN